MITNIEKIKNYVSIANSAGYIIWGTDNLKGYTHKLYLIIYRSDYGKTIEKTIKYFGDNIAKIQLDVQKFNQVVMTDKCKIIGIKNKGIADQICNLLRGENG